MIDFSFWNQWNHQLNKSINFDLNNPYSQILSYVLEGCNIRPLTLNKRKDKRPRKTLLNKEGDQIKYRQMHCGVVAITMFLSTSWLSAIHKAKVSHFFISWKEATKWSALQTSFFKLRISYSMMGSVLMFDVLNLCMCSSLPCLNQSQIILMIAERWLESNTKLQGFQ